MAREFTGGWETGGVVVEGFTGTGTALINSTAANLHKDRDGNGSAFCLQGSGGTNVARQRLQQTANMRNLVEAWDRVECFVAALGSGIRLLVHAYYSGATELGSVNIEPATGTITIYTGTATLVATSASGVFPYNRYFVMAIQFRLSDTVGLYNVYIDDVLVLTYSGDTKPGAETTFNTVGWGLGSTTVVDEYCRNSITMQYDNGISGTPTAGQTVTGGTSGATAVITSVEGTAASGVLVLQQWNGTAFQNNEAITTPALLNAQVNAPDASFVSGFEPNSKMPGEGCVVALVPTGVGTTTQLTSSTGGANWTTVDEIPPNSTDYNFSGTNNQYDTYVTSNLPSSAAIVYAVGGYAYAARDAAVINNFAAVVRSTADYFGATTALATTYAGYWYSWNVNPNSLTLWTVAEVNAAEVGFRVKT